MNKCLYCNNIFASGSNLRHHQKTARYCLEKQGKSTNQFLCSACGHISTSSFNLSLHTSRCIESIVSSEAIDMKKEISYLRETVEEQREELTEQQRRYDKHIKELQDKLENIALKAVSKSTTTTNNQINNYIANLEPLDIEKHFIDAAPNLTIEHVKRGAEGYADFAMEFPLKNRILCVDYSRRKVKFKNKDGHIVTDPEMTSLATKFFDSIWSQNKQLISLYGQELFESGEADTMEQVDKLITFSEGVRRSSEGERTDLQHDWVRSVCCRSLTE
jgi:hypothetical protein